MELTMQTTTKSVVVAASSLVALVVLYLTYRRWRRARSGDDEDIEIVMDSEEGPASDGELSDIEDTDAMLAAYKNRGWVSLFTFGNGLIIAGGWGESSRTARRINCSGHTTHKGATVVVGGGYVWALEAHLKKLIVVVGQWLTNNGPQDQLFWNKC